MKKVVLTFMIAMMSLNAWAYGATSTQKSQYVIHTLQKRLDKDQLSLIPESVHIYQSVKDIGLKLVEANSFSQTKFIFNRVQFLAKSVSGETFKGQTRLTTIIERPGFSAALSVSEYSNRIPWGNVIANSDGSTSFIYIGNSFYPVYVMDSQFDALRTHLLPF